MKGNYFYMKKIRTLAITFHQEIPQNKIRAFRGAIAQKVGLEHILFHQHKGDKQYVYNYPFIQYKRIDKKASIFCIDDGVEELHKLFGQNDWEIDLQGERILLTVDSLNLGNYELQVLNHKRWYRIENWIGLNAKNYNSYQKLSALKEQASFLERILIGNILSLAKGVEWHIDKQIELDITNILQTKTTRWKGVPLLRFDLEVQCNIALPDYIGLGKGVSHGHGLVTTLKNNR